MSSIWGQRALSKLNVVVEKNLGEWNSECLFEEMSLYSWTQLTEMTDSSSVWDACVHSRVATTLKSWCRSVMRCSTSLPCRTTVVDKPSSHGVPDHISVGPNTIAKLCGVIWFSQLCSDTLYSQQTSHLLTRPTITYSDVLNTAYTQGGPEKNRTVFEIR